MNIQIPFSKYLEFLKMRVPRKTGALAESWRIIETGQFYTIFASNLPYARIQDIGGRIPKSGSFVYPKNGKVMHFFINGKEIYTNKIAARMLPGFHYTKDSWNDFKSWMAQL